MDILAISGSARTGSTNSALLRAMASHAPVDVHVDLFENLVSFPIFSPNLEAERIPPVIAGFVANG